jgi:hypothetical protein
VSPATYTPKHLAERILTSKSAVEGERKQVTVLFVAALGRLHRGRGESDGTYHHDHAARDLVDKILSGLSEPGLHRGLETSPDIQEILAHGADR